MLRVGLTGELGSGKTTVARLLAQRGAIVLSSDEIARRMMQPAEPVYKAIVHHFGPGILLPGGSLNRAALAALAFDPKGPRIEELNALVHPPVIAEQERRMERIAREQPDAIVVIESALIFTTKHAGESPWVQRFDRIVLVTAPEEVKVERYVGRVAEGKTLSSAEREALATDARRRIAAQSIPENAISECLIIENNGDLLSLQRRTDEVFRQLLELAYRGESPDTA